MSDLSQMIRSVIEARSEKWQQAKALQTRGNLTEQENRKFEELVAEIEEMDARIDELHRLNVENKQMDEQRRPYEAIVRTDATAFAGHTDSRAKEEEEACQAMLRGEIRSVDLSFDKRDLSVGTDTAGGHLVPTGFRAQLIDAIRHETTVLSIPGIFEINTGMDGADLDVPLLTSHGTAVIVGEGSALSEADPAVNKRTLGAWKIAQIVQATSEIVADSRLDIPSMLARDLGRAIGYAAGTYYVTGTGTNQPEGVVTNAGTAVNGTATAGIQADEIVDMYYGLSPELRSRGVWLMSDTQAKQIRKLEDGSNRPLFEYETSLASGSPASLLGRPVYVSHAAAALGSGNASMVFFDPANFAVRTTNVRVERSDDFAFANDLVSWRAILRTDSKLMQHAAAQLYIGT